jgi:hypothetical protein
MITIHRRLVFLILLFLFASCAGQNVNTRAMGFYKLLTGQGERDSMVNYLSPAFRAELEKQNALKTFEAMGNALKLPGSSKLKALDAKSIHSDRDGNFAITWVEGLPDSPLVGSAPIKWVRVKGKWYLYMGSDAELKAYKAFPESLRKPVIAPPRASDYSKEPTKEEKAKDDAAKKENGQIAPEKGKVEDKKQTKPKGK